MTSRGEGRRATLIAIAIATGGCHILLGSEDFVDQGTGGDATGAATGTAGAGTGGSGPEDCTNGEDDDLDGDVDCADTDCGAFACVAPPPTGWSGPGALFIGAATAADCGALLPMATPGNVGPLTAPSASCGACTCGAPTGCNPPQVEVFQDIASCTGSLGFEVFSGNGNCQPTAGGNVDSLIALPVTGSGTCQPSGGAPSAPAPSWSSEGLVCSGTAGGGCGDAEVCSPAPPPGALGAQCIFNVGELPCPAGAYGERHVLFGGIADTRACSACGCGSAGCNGSIEIHSDSACGGLIQTVPTDGACTISTDPDNPFSLKFVAGANNDCPTIGGSPTGSAVGTEPVTVCCLGSGGTPVALEPAALSVDGNGVIEANEASILTPSWTNPDTLNAVDVAGAVSNSQGPPGTTYLLNDTSAGYAFGAGETAGCTDCYSVTASGTRVQAHWDFTLDEVLSSGQTKTWKLHVGQSFTDVATTHAAYGAVETLLHVGAVSDAISPATFSPSTTITRGDAALFVALVDNGGLPLPTSGAGYDCISGGSSSFTDVAPTGTYCAAANYLYANAITSGCNVSTFCPTATITRDAMAVWASVADIGTVPSLYTDSSTGLTYDCTDGQANQFTDVLDTNALCHFIHYVWARGGVNAAATTFAPAASTTRELAARMVIGTTRFPLYGP